jgi:hypothetical protein
MKWRVRLMRQAGRRIPWKILINEPALIGTIRTQVCNYGSQGPFKVAVLTVESVIEGGVELIEPQLLDLGDQVLIRRGYERLRNDGGTIYRVAGLAVRTGITAVVFATATEALGWAASLWPMSAQS